MHVCSFYNLKAKGNSRKPSAAWTRWLVSPAAGEQTQKADTQMTLGAEGRGVHICAGSVKVTLPDNGSNITTVQKITKGRKNSPKAQHHANQYFTFSHLGVFSSFSYTCFASFLDHSTMPRTWLAFKYSLNK